MAIKIQHCVGTLRLKVKAEGYAWLNAAAIEVNQIWNFANASSKRSLGWVPFKATQLKRKGKLRQESAR